jgi:hypothetical protein
MLLDQTTRMVAYLEVLTISYHVSFLRAVLMQDHERAYFDSADWVLGKVRQRREQNPRSRIQESHMFRVQTSD